MYAHWTTFRGDPSALDDGIAYVRHEVLPAVQQVDGCLGLSLLVDRQSGRCRVTTAWQSAAASHRGTEAIRSLRETAARTVRAAEGETEDVEWEIGVLHRVRDRGEGAATRVMRARGPIGQADRVVDAFRTSIVPRLEDLPGFCSVIVLVDSATGRCAIEATYESRQTMSRAKGQAQAMRQEFVERAGMHVTDVAEFDLEFAHLRVPETV